MKLTVGLGSIDEYPVYAEAGADEMFAGYVPLSFMEQGGLDFALNRREVLYYNVQLGTVSELEILASMMKTYQRPVAITLNSLTYQTEQYPMILEIIQTMLHYGLNTFIIADPVLLIFLEKLAPELRDKMTIHMSGEFGEYNHRMIRQAEEWKVSRIIFHRKVTIPDMKQIIDKGNTFEYEAFFLNEMCHFNGSYCHSFHCDELAPACRLPYHIRTAFESHDQEKESEVPKDTWNEGQEVYLPGAGGCGFCALWKLREAGVKVLKLVSRGNYVDDTVRDIHAAKTAIRILENSVCESDYITEMKRELFPKGCSGNCYYRGNAL